MQRLRFEYDSASVILLTNREGEYSKLRPELYVAGKEGWEVVHIEKTHIKETLTRFDILYKRQLPPEAPPNAW